jgi:hypothetical protein
VRVSASIPGSESLPSFGCSSQCARKLAEEGYPLIGKGIAKDPQIHSKLHRAASFTARNITRIYKNGGGSNLPLERHGIRPMAVLLMIGGKLPAQRAKPAHMVGHLPQLSHGGSQVVGTMLLWDATHLPQGFLDPFSQRTDRFR